MRQGALRISCLVAGLAAWLAAAPAAHATLSAKSRIANTNRVAQAAEDTNVTNWDKTNPIVCAVEVTTQNGDRIRTSASTTWEYRINGGSWTTLTTLGTI